MKTVYTLPDDPSILEFTDINRSNRWLTRSHDGQLLDPLGADGLEGYVSAPDTWASRLDAEILADTLEGGGQPVLVFGDLGNGAHLCGLKLHNSVLLDQDVSAGKLLLPWAAAISDKIYTFSEIIGTPGSALLIYFLVTTSDMVELRKVIRIEEHVETMGSINGHAVSLFLTGAMRLSAVEDTLRYSGTWNVRILTAAAILGMIHMVDADPVRTAIVHMNTKYAAMHSGKSFRIYDTLDLDQRGAHTWKSCSVREFGDMTCNRTVTIHNAATDTDKIINLGSAWLHSPDRREYDGFVFDPTGRVDKRHINLFQGFAIAPAAGNWSLMQDHILTIICGGRDDLERYVLNWMARMFQAPARPAETAIIMRGREGTGKGILMDALRKVIGPEHSRQISQARHLVGNFNQHLRNCILLCADEAFYAGDKSGVGALNSLITESTLEIEAKRVDTVTSPNMLHVMMASNEKWVVPAGPDSRRYVVLDVSEAQMQKAAYFSALAEQMEAGGYAAMHYDLLRRDISTFRPQTVPMTEGLNDQRELTLATEYKWWMDHLAGNTEWQLWQSTSSLVSSYEAFAKSAHQWHLLSSVQLAKFLKSVGGHASRPQLPPPSIGEEPIRLRGYRFGPLAAARTAFEAAAKVTIDWPVYEDEADMSGGKVVPIASARSK